MSTPNVRMYSEPTIDSERFELQIKTWLEAKVKEAERDSRRGIKNIVLRITGAWPELLASLDALLDAKDFCTEPCSWSTAYILVRRKPVIEEENHAEVQNLGVSD